ncbi:hypothetical protein IMSAGC006_00372 [Muribaculaceae bacterium]|nr:hypothetical protein IMSAGC006_00372 [Muribaculaceae bacterium]
MQIPHLFITFPQNYRKYKKLTRITTYVTIRADCISISDYYNYDTLLRLIPSSILEVVPITSGRA